ncbi:hypothetical protein BDA96_04G338800 [Sorghum bicolor]|uniref:Embryo surrounding factor 1 brassicaceae domain-containing protein n=2 Tax=Sorghum bicolor TaxID=4558 RepID=A0A921R8I7_SORBI|nr:hypothetical protein BDA96_04G338800 [Sorghum bicolor]OQU85813.1 hypothetical protein SORBI_3004G316350 [Sorghum bicolor]
MRMSHGALLAMVVMAMLSTGICTEFPPEYACSKILYSSGCDDRWCQDDCFRQLKGAAMHWQGMPVLLPLQAAA